MKLEANFAQYDAIFGDEPASYVEFLDALLRSMEKARSGLVAAAEVEDWNVISATRHSLKPTLTLLGAQALNDALDQWRPAMSALDSSLVEQGLTALIQAVEAKRNGLNA